MRNILTLCLLALVGLLGCQSSKTSKTSSQNSKQATSKDAVTKSVANKNLSYKPFAEFNGDTLQYLNYNFVDHKEQYIGKTFSVLYNDLEIPVKSCTPTSDNRNVAIAPGLILSFYDSETETYLMNSVGPSVPTSFTVIVTWEKPVSSDALLKFYKASDGNWSSSFETFLAGEIVKDVAVLKYVNPQSTKQ